MDVRSQPSTTLILLIDRVGAHRSLSTRIHNKGPEHYRFVCVLLAPIEVYPMEFTIKGLYCLDLVLVNWLTMCVCFQITS